MKTKFFLSALCFACLLAACKKENTGDDTAALALNITGLEDVGANARYEGWIMVNGSPVSTGTFSVNAAGNATANSFTVNKTQLANATAFVLTIEPYPDANPAPSEQKIMAGDFSNATASINVGHAAALGTNFAAATGKYVLATPTTATTTDELSGLWFLSLMTGAPTSGLSLPALPAGWKYEGWAVVGGKPISTGVFSNANMADASSVFSGTSMAPAFPGEDFIVNAPAGFSFPTNLSGGLAVISVEPFPDNSPAPFLLKPLIANIPAGAQDHVTYNMTLNTASLPTGTASR